VLFLLQLLVAMAVAIRLLLCFCTDGCLRCLQVQLLQHCCCQSTLPPFHTILTTVNTIVTLRCCCLCCLAQQQLHC
jgi:hypothetical protein